MTTEGERLFFRMEGPYLPLQYSFFEKNAPSHSERYLPVKNNPTIFLRKLDYCGLYFDEGVNTNFNSVLPTRPTPTVYITFDRYEAGAAVFTVNGQDVSPDDANMKATSRGIHIVAFNPDKDHAKMWYNIYDTCCPDPKTTNKTPSSESTDNLL